MLCEAFGLAETLSNRTGDDPTGRCSGDTDVAYRVPSRGERHVVGVDGIMFLAVSQPRQ